MKKLVLLFLTIIICLHVFSGCKVSEKADIPFEYTCEVLIDKELPDQSFVWAGKIQTPTRGVSMIEFPEDYFNGIVTTNGIQDFVNHSGGVDYKDYSLDNVCKALKISKKDLSKKFNMAINPQDIWIWEDVILCHFYVPEENQLDGKSVEFAGKFVFIEYCGTDEAYIQAVSSEEYTDAHDPFKIHSVDSGRIGNRFYLSNGYYDLIEHKYQLYENESDIPPYSGHKRLLRSSLSLELLKENAVLKEEITESMYILSDIHIIKDRIYLIVGRNERYYDGGGDENVYGGSVLLTIMLDADTYEILYVAKYHSSNYNIGTKFGFYQINEEGILCDPYVID